MRKNSLSESGLFNPRIFAAFLLCSMGAWLAMFSFAAATAPAGEASATVQPVVIASSANSISRPLRELPKAPSTERGEFENGLRRVKADHPVPKNFVDPALQSPTGNSSTNQASPSVAAAAPSPNLTFEGMNQSEGCGGCIPPDPNGTVGPTQYVQMVNSAIAVYDKAGTR